MTMSTTDAISNLQNLIHAALKGGIFSDSKSVLVIQSSLDTLSQVVEEKIQNLTKSNNREIKEVAERFD